MKRMMVLAGVIVFGASVAASAAVISRDQWNQFFSSNDAYSNGFRAGYAAGVADAANAAYGNPGLINPSVAQCAQTAPVPTLMQLADAAIRQWLGSPSPRVTAAVQILGAYTTCVPELGREGPDKK